MRRTDTSEVDARPVARCAEKLNRDVHVLDDDESDGDDGDESNLIGHSHIASFMLTAAEPLRCATTAFSSCPAPCAQLHPTSQGYSANPVNPTF